MGLPEAREAQSFHRSAKQRYVDAQFLLEAGRTTGAVYLAGYGVECILKALIISAVPNARRAEVLASFRGARAHDYEWLKTQYGNLGGPSIPAEVREHLVRVNSWSADFRYLPGTIEHEDAHGFLAAAEAVMSWAEGRL